MADSWLIDGNCEKCRRQTYCTKPCTKAKRRQEMFLKNLVTKKIFECAMGTERKG